MASRNIKNKVLILDVKSVHESTLFDYLERIETHFRSSIHEQFDLFLSTGHCNLISSLFAYHDMSMSCVRKVYREYARNVLDKNIIGYSYMNTSSFLNIYFKDVKVDDTSKRIGFPVYNYLKNRTEFLMNKNMMDDSQIISTLKESIFEEETLVNLLSTFFNDPRNSNMVEMNETTEITILTDRYTNFHEQEYGCFNLYNYYGRPREGYSLDKLNKFLQDLSQEKGVGVVLLTSLKNEDIHYLNQQSFNRKKNMNLGEETTENDGPVFLIPGRSSSSPCLPVPSCSLSPQSSCSDVSQATGPEDTSGGPVSPTPSGRERTGSSEAYEKIGPFKNKRLGKTISYHNRNSPRKRDPTPICVREDATGNSGSLCQNDVCEQCNEFKNKVNEFERTRPRRFDDFEMPPLPPPLPPKKISSTPEPDTSTQTDPGQSSLSVSVSALPSTSPPSSPLPVSLTCEDNSTDDEEVMESDVIISKGSFLGENYEDDVVKTFEIGSTNEEVLDFHIDSESTTSSPPSDCGGRRSLSDIVQENYEQA